MHLFRRKNYANGTFGMFQSVAASPPHSAPSPPNFAIVTVLGPRDKCYPQPTPLKITMDARKRPEWPSATTGCSVPGSFKESKSLAIL